MASSESIDSPQMTVPADDCAFCREINASTGEPRPKKSDRNAKIAFLGGVTVLGVMAGFGSAVAMAKKRDPTSFDKGLFPGAEHVESGGRFALRALGWGTLFAVGGVGLLCFTVYKVLDVQDAADFRRKMTTIMPNIPKKPKNPNDRTEFESVREFFQYIGAEKGK